MNTIRIQSPTSQEPLTAQPLAELPELEELAGALHVNVSDRERIASGIAGAVLLLSSSGRPSLLGWLGLCGGAALLLRAVSGHCSLYYHLGKDSRSQAKVA